MTTGNGTPASTTPPIPPVVCVPTTDSAPSERRVLMHHVEDGRIALYT